MQATLPEGFDPGFKLHSADDVTLEVKATQPETLKWQALLSASALPGQVEDFVGREEIMLTVLQHLGRRRVVVLHCQRSLGRTSTLVEIARYVSAPGRRFSSNCIFGPVQPLQKGLLIPGLPGDFLFLAFLKNLLGIILSFFFLKGFLSKTKDCG